jgi:hypothetical protein
MSKLIPRKIKKACKAYRIDVPLKTRRLRYVRTQVLGRVDRFQTYIGDYKTSFSTKYGELLSEYIDYGILE